MKAPIEKLNKFSSLQVRPDKLTGVIYGRKSMKEKRSKKKSVQAFSILLKNLKSLYMKYVKILE